MPRPGGAQFKGGQQSSGLSLIRHVSIATAPPVSTHHPRMQTVPSSLTPSSARWFMTVDRTSCSGNGLQSTYSHSSSLAPPSSQNHRDTSRVPNGVSETNTRIVPVFKPVHSARQSSGAQPDRSVRPAAIVPSFKPTAPHLNTQTASRTTAEKQGRVAPAHHQKRQLGQKHTLREPTLQPSTKLPRVNDSGITGSGASNNAGSKGGEKSMRVVPISSSSEQMVPDLSQRPEPDQYSSEYGVLPTSPAVTGKPSQNTSSTGGCGAGPTTQKKVEYCVRDNIMHKMRCPLFSGLIRVFQSMRLCVHL